MLVASLAVAFFVLFLTKRCLRSWVGGSSGLGAFWYCHMFVVGKVLCVNKNRTFNLFILSRNTSYSL